MGLCGGGVWTGAAGRKGGVPVQLVTREGYGMRPAGHGTTVCSEQSTSDKPGQGNSPGQGGTRPILRPVLL